MPFSAGVCSCISILQLFRFRPWVVWSRNGFSCCEACQMPPPAGWRIAPLARPLMPNISNRANLETDTLSTDNPNQWGLGATDPSGLCLNVWPTFRCISARLVFAWPLTRSRRLQPEHSTRAALTPTRSQRLGIILRGLVSGRDPLPG